MHLLLLLLEAFGLVVWSGACLQKFSIQSINIAARGKRIETPCPFILFSLAFRIPKQDDHMGSVDISVLVMKNICLTMSCSLRQKALFMVTFLLSENILKNCHLINMIGMGDWGDIMKNKYCLLHGPLCWFKTASTFPNKSMFLQRGQPFKRSISERGWGGWGGLSSAFLCCKSVEH